MFHRYNFKKKQKRTKYVSSFRKITNSTFLKTTNKRINITPPLHHNSSPQPFPSPPRCQLQPPRHQIAPKHLHNANHFPVHPQVNQRLSPPPPPITNRPASTSLEKGKPISWLWANGDGPGLTSRGPKWATVFLARRSGSAPLLVIDSYEGWGFLFLYLLRCFF